VIASTMIMATMMLAGASAAPHERRFALVVGHNEGAPGEQPLQFANLDAERMAAVLLQVGGFQAPDAIALVNSRDDADAVWSALDDLEARLRAATATGQRTLLMVYYSGHASQSALHLGASELNLRDLDRRLQDSAATVRVLVLDACRSGSITRVKGDAFAQLGTTGYAVVTASAADEDAAESDQLQGSFFSHAFSSGLLGPADQDGDGQVTLPEAYQYAFDHTVRLSASSSGAIQHPTFRYDLRGRTDVVLTHFGDEQSMVVAPEQTRFLLLSSGRVIAEVDEQNGARTIAVSPGRYTVVARTKDAIYEGDIDVSSRQSTVVDLAALQSSSFARLVRKGGDASTPIIGFAMGAQLQSGPVIPSWGLHLQLPIALSWATVTPGLDLGYGWADRAIELPKALVHQDVLNLRMTTMMSMVFDASWVSFSLGALAGVQLVHQTTRRSYGYADDESTIAFGVVGGVDVAVQVPVFDRWFIETGLEGSLGTITATSGFVQPDAVTPQASARLLVGVWL
jgi:Caspase domain